MRDALAVTCGDVSRHVTDVWIERLDVLPDFRKYSIEYAFWPGLCGIRPYYSSTRGFGS